MSDTNHDYRAMVSNIGWAFDGDQEATILKMVEQLNKINFQIAELKTIQEEIDKRLVAMLDHKEDGQSSYKINKYKLVVKTGYNYSLNIKKYEELKKCIPEGFDPVKKVIKYELNKTMAKHGFNYLEDSNLKLFSDLVIRKPSKISVTISAGV